MNGWNLIIFVLFERCDSHLFISFLIIEIGAFNGPLHLIWIKTINFKKCSHVWCIMLIWLMFVLLYSPCYGCHYYVFVQPKMLVSNPKCLSPTKNACLQPKTIFSGLFFLLLVKSVFNAAFLLSIQLQCKCNNASGCNMWHCNSCTKDTISW